MSFTEPFIPTDIRKVKRFGQYQSEVLDFQTKPTPSWFLRVILKELGENPDSIA